MSVQVRVFGGVDVEIDGQVVDLGPARQRCVLAVLVAQANRPVTTNQLVDRVWGDTPPSRGHETLYGYLSRLRTALTPVPEVAIERDSRGYRLTVDETAVDLHRFRTLITQARTCADDDVALTLLDQAIAVGHGEPFAGLNTPWLADLRTAVIAQQYTAALDRTDLALRCGRYADVVAELSARVAEHPLDERVAGQFLLGLFRTGRQAEALAHYQQMRTRLAEDLGSDPGPALQAIYQQILTRVDSAPPDPVPSRRPPVPRQLPAAPAGFTGRESELAALSQVVSAAARTGRTVVISAIGGAGGIGKTWLALHWAHRHVDRFPDGQLFVDLQGFAPAGEPVAPHSAVRRFLDGLGVGPARIPTELDAQIALYRSTIADRRMLVVLDNAADAAQVVPLLPGSPTCTVLITSRRYLASLIANHDAHSLPLGVLSGDEARHLLAARLGADRVADQARAVSTLLAWCGGFPLALGIVVGQALAHPDFPLSALAAEISEGTWTLDAWDDGDTAASLPAVLSWSMRALRDEHVQLFGLLGIAPGPDISLPAAACLAAIAEGRARVLLRELENASLIQQHVPGRYRMHDVIRRYATDIAHRDIAEQVRETAVRRMIDFCLHTAHAADRLLNPHRQPLPLAPPLPGVHPEPIADDPAAMAWFDAEHPVLLAALHVAIREHWNLTVWQLSWPLGTYHRRRGHHDRLAVRQAAVDAAILLPDPTPRIQAHRLLGHAYTDLRRPEEGIEHLHQALVLAERHHDAEQQAHAHWALSGAVARRGDDRQARQHATRARDLYRALDQQVGEADALNAMGWYAARLGEYDTASADCRAALVLHRRHHNTDGEADTLDSLGYIAHRAGRHRQAVDHYRQALTLFRTLGNDSSAADTLDNLGHSHLALGEREQAHVVWREAWRLYQEQGRDNDAERTRRQLDAGRLVADVAGSAADRVDEEEHHGRGQ